MNTHMTGAARRPMLSLNFGSVPRQEAARERRPATLPRHELQRIVAAMLD